MCLLPPTFWLCPAEYRVKTQNFFTVLQQQTLIKVVILQKFSSHLGLILMRSLILMDLSPSNIKYFVFILSNTYSNFYVVDPLFKLSWFWQLAFSKVGMREEHLKITLQMTHTIPWLSALFDAFGQTQHLKFSACSNRRELDMNLFFIAYHSTLSNMPVWDSAVFQSVIYFATFYLHCATPALSGNIFHPFKDLFVLFFLLCPVMGLVRLRFSFPFFFFLRPIIPKVTEGFKHSLWSQCSPALQGIYKNIKIKPLFSKPDQLNIFFCGVAVGVRYLHGFAATDP